MKHPLLFAAALVAGSALATGCGGSDAGPKIRSFDATPGILPTAGGTVTLTWDASADSLAIEPGVGAVTGTAHTVAVTQTTEFELVARKNGRVRRARTLVTVAGPSTVTGLVRSMINRTPLPGIAIYVNGVAVTTTDVDGRFAFDSVPTPYRIAIFDPESFTAVVYDGVTRPDPILEMPFFFAGASRDAVVSGTVTPAESDPDVSTDVWIDNGHMFYPTTASAAEVSGAYAATMEWTGGPTQVPADVLALRYDTGGDEIVYTHFGRTSFTADDDVASDVDVSILPIGSDHIAGQFTGPSWLDVSFGYATLLLGEPTGSAQDVGLILPGSILLGTAGDFSMPVPDIDGSVVQLWTGVSDADGTYAFLVTNATAGDEELVIEKPTRPPLLTPINGGTIAPGTAMFRMSGRQDSVKLWFFGGFDTFITWISMDSEVAFPELEGTGIDLAINSYVDWGVMEVGSHSSMDEVLGPDGLLGEAPEFVLQSETFRAYIGGGS